MAIARRFVIANASRAKKGENIFVFTGRIYNNVYLMVNHLKIIAGAAPAALCVQPFFRLYAYPQ